MIKPKLVKISKKMFNRRNRLLSVSVLLLILGLAVWVLNIGFLGSRNAKAASGDFNETWVASEAFGAYVLENISPNASANWAGTIGSTGAIAGGQGCATTINNSPISGCSTFSANIMGMAARLDPQKPGNFVTKWTVTGRIEP